MRPLTGRPLREPEPQKIGAGVAKVRVTFEATMDDGRVVTYEFHNIGFDPHQVAPLSGDRTHGIDMATWRPEDEGDLLLRPNRAVVRQEPEEIDLRVRGTLRPKSDTEHETARWFVTQPEEGQ